MDQTKMTSSEGLHISSVPMAPGSSQSEAHTHTHTSTHSHELSRHNTNTILPPPTRQSIYPQIPHDSQAPTHTQDPHERQEEVIKTKTSKTIRTISNLDKYQINNLQNFMDHTDVQRHTNNDVLASAARATNSTHPELHIIGELEAGYGFYTSGGLFCEMTFEMGVNWKSVSPSDSNTQQTQTAYASVSDVYAWNHPIDMHFACGSMGGWPMLRISVWELSVFGKVGPVAFASIGIPTSSGHHKIECKTWRPLGTFSEELQGRILGRGPCVDVWDKNGGRDSASVREGLVTVSSGTVCVCVSVLQRHFAINGLQTNTHTHPQAYALHDQHTNENNMQKDIQEAKTLFQAYLNLKKNQTAAS